MSNPTNFFPLMDQALVKPVAAPAPKSSIILSSAPPNERTVIAVVLDVGPDVDKVAIGDTVIFCREHGFAVKLDGEEFVFVKQQHIMASSDGADLS